MANRSGLCSHGNYNLEGNVRGLELERGRVGKASDGSLLSWQWHLNLASICLS